MQNEKRLAIVGGGPGGLMLARILATRGIAATVLEHESHPDARPQGGSLDIHRESGQFALQHAGLEQRFKALARYEDQGDALYDQHGTLHFELRPGLEGDRPEIDRTQLRALLLKSLAPETVRWGCKVPAVEPLADGRYRVWGEQGALGDFDWVIGADGAWSKVRPLVSSAQPAYTGVTFVELSIDALDTRHPVLAKLIPTGKIGAVGDNRSIVAQRSSGGHLGIYCMLRVPEDWMAEGGLDLTSPARARQSLKSHFAGWSPKLLALIDASSDRIVPRPIVALPIGHRWTHRPGVTLLGDAAHVMSPFSGEGVNLAMLDAAELALQLAENSDWSRAVTAYEERMFARAEEAAAGAAEGLDFISKNALERAMEHFHSIQASV